MTFYDWGAALRSARAMSGQRQQRMALLAVRDHRYSAWRWKVVPSGGSEHRSHRTFLDEQAMLHRRARS